MSEITKEEKERLEFLVIEEMKNWLAGFPNAPLIKMPRPNIEYLFQIIESKSSELKQLKDDLQNSVIVHSNILAGNIKLSKRQALHIAGVDADIEEQLLATKRMLSELEEQVFGRIDPEADAQA